MEDMKKLVHERDIKNVLIEYATALDSKIYERLENVFLPDSLAVYYGVGECQGLAEITALVSGVLSQCGQTQHLLSNYQIQVEGQIAWAKCYLQAIHVGKGDYEGELMTVWGEYSDELKLTDQGWRIARRELETLHSQGDIGLT
ncbi:nuclear transport factor 2 family protein [Aestuariicella hydrocarbonica]|uniref:Nuclear transport factor 2 family protein n=1 Tax=Pseudomaricurvus hydrocarbonicus TaxID=1470433 RepID=A0A9E5JY98_9GAMM|nr:nuclear transport factor 2 family protein [Aestuariicella hydrocarbonica]NHO66866.1 nuclear transport factor 2 family protein [Aestuariicella hydrocarbonica]